MRLNVKALAKWAAIVLMVVAGCGLIAISPMLLLLGAWAGSDGGTVVGGLASIFGLPWAFYCACTAITLMLLRYRAPIWAVAVAFVPFIPAALIAVQMHH